MLNKLFIDQEVHKLSHKTEYPGYESAALNYALSVKNNKPKQNLLTRNNTQLEAEWNLKSLSNPSEQSVNPAIEMFRTHDNRLEQATAKKRKLNEDLRRKKIVLINRKELLKRHRQIKLDQFHLRIMKESILRNLIVRLTITKICLLLRHKVIDFKVN